MSIFDLFGKIPTLEKTAQRLYKSKGALYLPKGERQVYNILVSLAEIYGYIPLITISDSAREIMHRFK